MSKVPRLFFGPMSVNAVKAVYKVSHERRIPLGLIASLNQVNKAGGYTGWTTATFAAYCRELVNIFPLSNVWLCRDHLGIGFHPTNNTYATILEELREDLRRGFDLIHIDSSRDTGNSWGNSYLLANIAISERPGIKIEYGSEDIQGKLGVNLQQLEQDLKILPDFYVVNTGSLVKWGWQVGTFDLKSTQAAARLLKNYHIRLKEHNADFLSTDQLVVRREYVDALNVAPQLATVETTTVLQQCYVYGINSREFINYVYSQKNWEKWIQYFEPEEVFIKQFGEMPRPFIIPIESAVVAGHYHYQSTEWQYLLKQLRCSCDIDQLIRNNLEQVILHYIRNFS